MGRLVDQVVEAIHAAEKRGVTRYRIAKDAGVFHSQLSRLMNGERSISVDTLEKICAALGLTIEIRDTRKKR